MIALLPLTVLLTEDNPPPGAWCVSPIEPDLSDHWRTLYGTRVIDIADRTVYFLHDDRGNQCMVWMAPIEQFRGTYGVTMLDAWHHSFSEWTRQAILGLGRGLMIPIPVDGTRVWRAEEMVTEAWPGEMDTTGPVARGELEHRWGMVG